MADDEKGDSSWKLRKFDGSFEDLLTLLVENNELSKQEKGAAYLWDERTQERVLSLARKDDVETALGAIKSKFPPSVGAHSKSCTGEDHPEVDCTEWMINKTIANAGVVQDPEQLFISMDRMFCGFRLPCPRTGLVVLDPQFEIGRGAHSVVYHAKGDASQDECVVKVSALEYNDTLQNEEHILLFLNRYPCAPGVPRVLGSGFIGENRYLALDGIGQTLHSFLQEAGGPCSQTLATVETIAADLVPSLYRMHEKGVLHRDICPKNIIRLDGKWRFVDFGSACFSADRHTPFATTSLFASFSVLNGAPEYDPEDDFSALFHTLSYCYQGVEQRHFTLMNPPAHPDVVALLNRVRETYRPIMGRQMLQMLAGLFEGKAKQQ